jgi:peptidoglycan/LPS O-acetylase OafA/YrhL
MLFRTVSRIVVLIAVPIILCSAIFVLYVGLDGSLPAIFGFERGYVVVAGLQFLVAIVMLVNGIKPNLLSQGTD